MGLFHSKTDKDAKKAARERKKETSVFFYGQTLQPVGKIAAGQPVGISLNPDIQALNIHHDKTDITLPYNRIISFLLDSDDKLTSSGNAGLRALAGGALFGTVGSVVGAASAKSKTSKRWIAVLTYKDKEGATQSLSFLQMALTKPYDGETKHYGAAKFEKAINEICSRCGEEITEL